MRTRTSALTLVAVWLAASPLSGQDLRPIDYADHWRTVSIGGVQVSPDETRALYVSSPRSFPDRPQDSQIHMAALDGSWDRQLTRFTDGQHRDARWHPRGDLFGFTAVREGDQRQLYLMDPEGGEPRRVTEAERGVISWAWSEDGQWLAFLTGRDADRQVWLLDGRGERVPRQLTEHSTPVSSFQWSEAGHEILFIAPDEWDADDARRRQAGFQARTIQRGYWHDDFLEIHPAHLWVADLSGEARRLTGGDFRVLGFEQSPDADRIALSAGPMDPYLDWRANEVYLLSRISGEVQRLTDNDVGESVFGFSPDGRWLAISAPSDFRYGGVNEIWLMDVERGGAWRNLTADFDNDIFGGVWSDDSRRVVFVGADGVNHQLYEAMVASGQIRRLTDGEGVISLANDEEGRLAVLQFTDPHSPRDLYTVSWNQVADRDRWTRVTHSNPWVDEVALARYETVRWTSVDGTGIEGIVIHPLERDPNRSYPLITQIHGGPASAYRNQFSATHGTYPHLLAAQGYAVFQPNYRGSSNYGDRFKDEIAGDYWTRATEDIHTGIDHLIERGIAHPDSLGLMGWSAGGHWSNWMLVTTDRFRAIASGAGVTNWISLYAQTDVQASREYYLGGDGALDAPNKPWDDFDHWWAESPLKYITQASTPTLIHFGERDPRIPMPQGQELHMALARLGVPTEFLVYPDEPHGLQRPRNQLVKMHSEVRWFDRWIRGSDRWLDWAEVMELADQIERSLAPAEVEVPAGVATDGGR